MVDTVAFEVKWKIPATLEPNADWNYFSDINRLTAPKESRKWVKKHPSGMRIYCQKQFTPNPRTGTQGNGSPERRKSGAASDETVGYVTRVEVSLSRALFGDNGSLIQTPAQLTEALEKVDHIARSVGLSPEGRKLFNRVDLVWHFDVPTLAAILAFFARDHRDFRKPTVRLYRVGDIITGIECLGGDGGELTIRMYDKQLERNQKAAKRKLLSSQRHSRILRVEFQIEGKKLARLFCECRAEELGYKPFKLFRRPTDLSFDHCQKIFRRLLRNFGPPQPQLALKSSPEKVDSLKLTMGSQPPIPSPPQQPLSDSVRSPKRKRVDKPGQFSAATF